MEDIKDLLTRLMNRVDGSGISDQDLGRQISAIYKIYAGAVGTQQLVVNASRFDALRYIHDDDPRVRLLGLERLILESRDYEKIPADEDIPEIIDSIEEKLAEILARQAVEQRLEKKISNKIEEKNREYVNQIRKEIINEESGNKESPQSMHRLEKLNAMDKVSLTKTMMTVVRPSSLDEIVGQDDAVQALASRVASPFPQHILLYGPPGVGKTTAARLVLEEAKKRPYSAFAKDAPFVECDGTTLRFDSRDMTNPLIGSVHDPIYQGARKELAEEGIPEPKPGLVTEAHGGVLFIDEIGELDPMMLNKLLKVLEDKRVYFESAYYDEDNPRVPAYIKKLFKEGAPADFLLIGATTRRPEEISPAIRSRCAEIFFRPLQPKDIADIVEHAAEKLHVSLEKGVPELISEYTMEGRKAVSLLADAYALAVYSEGSPDHAVITKEFLQSAARASRLSPWNKEMAEKEPRVGHVYGLGVAGYLGTTIEIESKLFPSAQKGRGVLSFNQTAGSMAKDSVQAAASVARMMTGKNLSDYDLHMNIIGGGQVDGPSAGAAITVSIISTLTNTPIRQDYALTGEISLSGEIKPVGGLSEKAFGARRAGMKGMLIPWDNRTDISSHELGLNVIPVKTIQDVMQHMLAPADKKGDSHGR